MATDAAGENFITVVPVGEGRPIGRDPSFVTVLTVGATAGAEVIVRRSRGERLGLGLKFEGGSAATEKVRRLLVQSCAEDSPAAKASTPWGKLIPGDEILAIDGTSVSDLTRIDCVRRLKDSDETLTLLVRHFGSESKCEQKDTESKECISNTKQIADVVRPSMLPPPVPPRKLGKKNSFKDKHLLQTLTEQNTSLNNDSNFIDKDISNSKHNGISKLTKLCRKSSFDSHLHRQTKEGIAYLKKGSPEEVRRLVRRLSDGKAIPAEADVYIDLFSTEWERCLVIADTESDDTGSSISTVVDKLGSMANSVENSIPSTPTMQPKTIDIQKVLNCIENIDTNILKDLTSKRFLDEQSDYNNITKVPETLNTINENINHLVTAPFLSNGGVTESKSISFNDKNDKIQDSMHNREVHSTNVVKKSDDRLNHEVEKPKPMPRNSKVERSVSERKPRPISVPDISPPPIPENLLTPTKKTCIETWLKRSEAEMNCKNVEKSQENIVPEVLPRLIDFVPKPQYKENESSVIRPTTAPPPPPTETREDGSGASLDTIGELDESGDVIDSAKPMVIETKQRKSSFETSFWDDRINKSDAEDKSLSNDETPLPSCPRQPPDGVETPSEAVEKIPELPSRLPPRLPAAWPKTRSRYSYSSRTQDARSEASVKDKIAMFSNDQTASSDRVDKCGTLPSRNSPSVKNNMPIYSSSYSDISSLDRRLTKSQDNLDDMPVSYKRHTVRPAALGAHETTMKLNSNFSTINKRSALHAENKPLFYGSTTTLPSSVDATFSPPIYHVRSVSDDNGKKKQSPHKSNLEYLIEQRKKSMSKLRGLAIPEVQAPIVDLPEIKVKDPFSKSFLLKSNQSNASTKTDKPNNTKPPTLNEAKWKANLLPNNIPKYSPAFKRKSLQVYSRSSLSKESTPERQFSEKIDTFSKINNNVNNRPQRMTLNTNDMSLRDSKTTSNIKNNILTHATLPKKDYKDISNYASNFKNVDIKICTATDVVDSDNDSAMSSTQSSYRSSASSPMHNLDTVESDGSRLSPRISHYTTYSIIKTEANVEKPINSLISEKSGEEYIKRNICRSISSDTNVSLSSSAGSAATSGSQASCSSLESSVADSDKRKVLKPLTIDTINRRNILASAKCRSGRDAKVKSPLIEAKFSHESCDSSPSPVLKMSERLSTLTSSVSAMSNKGENRRRNKKVAESDSDSDSDVNIRQRKTEFKNTRVKRNSSSANKNKQNDVSVEIPKVEDAPKVISEKIIKEINKAGLDNFKDTKPTFLDINNFDFKKSNELLLRKEEKSKKSATSQQNNNYIISGTTDLKETVQITSKSNRGELKSCDQSDNNLCEENKVLTQIIRLKKGDGSGVGVILAGGIDCEAKEVTVHRVLGDSVAAKAGLKRGTKIRSINGSVMAGLTHAQTVSILKEQRSEVLIEIEHENQSKENGVQCGSEKAESKVRHEADKSKAEDNSTVVSVLLEKAGGGAGLGFGLDGGRDSPNGDRPLTVKKLFAGGAAAQSGRVIVGAELLSAGGQSMEGFTRTQAWAALKALPTGPVTLVLRNPKGRSTP